MNLTTNRRSFLFGASVAGFGVLVQGKRSLAWGVGPNDTLNIACVGSAVAGKSPPTVATPWTPLTAITAVVRAAGGGAGGAPGTVAPGTTPPVDVVGGTGGVGGVGGVAVAPVVGACEAKGSLLANLPKDAS